MSREARVDRLAKQISSACRAAESLGLPMAAHILSMARLEVDLSEQASLTLSPAYGEAISDVSEFTK